MKFLTRKLAIAASLPLKNKISIHAQRDVSLINEPMIRDIIQVKILTDAVGYFSKFGAHSEKVKQLSGKFVNLAPTDKADDDWIYFSALNKAIRDPDVYNIALTGPYGSGKSSVIRSFLKRHKKPALEISLASFLTELDSNSAKASKQEIERSILQQMLYGAEANKLPLSRFKRIRAPRSWNWAVSLTILLGCMALWHLFQSRDDLLSGEFYKPLQLTNWFNLSVAAFGFAFVWYTLHRIYLKSFGVSLKSVSLTDVEIIPETAEEESILNRHLDEIIYFFQSTKYALVIIEDLDRFDNPDIFVTLREINSLINANFGVKKKVRFLYALRDDIFKNTDRTKFFEFIVPVIPIINHSNSIDKVLEEGQRLAIEQKLDAQFLREVSRYLIDLRLIKNIFNEFVTYAETLGSANDDSLDPNKLLAVLIYKNVQPEDFEKLHQQQGVLADILSRYEKLVSNAEDDLQAEILKIESSVAEADKQLPKSLSELRKIYAMALVELAPANAIAIRSGNTNIPLRELADHTEFESFLSSKNLSFRTSNQGNVVGDISALEAKVDADMTYMMRKVEVERNSAEGRRKASSKVRELRSKMASIRTEKFGDIVRTNASQIEGSFSELGKSKDLVKFLIFEGFLDDTYYQYISLFHSGRLSPNDNKFLIQIRSYCNPDPDFRLDNQAEVIAMMRAEDFNQNYVLNRYLMDEMFENATDYSDQISRAMKYISGDFENCSGFFDIYYSSGKQVGGLINALADCWDGFPTAALDTSANVEHIARILEHVPPHKVVKKLNVDGIISSYLGTNLSAVMAATVAFDLDIIELLEVEVDDISILLSDQRSIQFVIEKSLYRITADNIRVVLEHELNEGELAGLSEKHYTTVLGSKNEKLCTYIEQNFVTYLRRILLKIEGNTREDTSTILTVLGHNEVSQEFLEEFLVMQDVVFPSFDLIPPEFHTLLLKNQMVEATWKNVISFVQADEFNPDVLTQFMQSAGTKSRLLQSEYSNSDQSLELSRFILHNEGFSDEEYRSYLKKLPTWFDNFPESASTSRRLILIEERTIRLTEEVFQAVQNDKTVVVCLLAHNIDKFLEDRSKFPIDDSIREMLLTSKISDAQKLLIIEDVDPATLPANASMAKQIGSIFNRVDIDTSAYGPDFVQALLQHATPLTAKVSLLNKCHKALSLEQVRQIIEGMPDPFPDALVAWRHPRIPNTPDNELLVKWLEERKIISSSRITALDDIKINTFRKQRLHEE
jgi:hypothetical protein